MVAHSVLDAYAVEADGLLDTFEAVDSAEVYEPVAGFLPTAPVRLCDIGAGTGRDAAWFAAQGHEVLAVEPMDALRGAGAGLHPSARITWVKDALPELNAVHARAERFECVLMCGVWHHLEQHERAAAMPRVAALIVQGGRLIFSLRHGPGAEHRPCFPSTPETEIARAEAAGLTLCAARVSASVSPANRALGVTRTWLVFENTSR